VERRRKKLRVISQVSHEVVTDDSSGCHLVVTDDSGSCHLVVTDDSGGCHLVVTDNSACSQLVVNYVVTWVMSHHFVVRVVTLSSFSVAQVARIF
jgi:hypothetical protein